MKSEIGPRLKTKIKNSPILETVLSESLNRIDNYLNEELPELVDSDESCKYDIYAEVHDYRHYEGEQDYVIQILVDCENIRKRLDLAQEIGGLLHEAAEDTAQTDEKHEEKEYQEAAYLLRPRVYHPKLQNRILPFPERAPE